VGEARVSAISIAAAGTLFRTRRRFGILVSVFACFTWNLEFGFCDFAVRRGMFSCAARSARTRSQLPASTAQHVFHSPR
jgi:hypothetical protein